MFLILLMQEFGSSPLCYAAREGHADVVELLISVQPDLINRTDSVLVAGGDKAELKNTISFAKGAVCNGSQIARVVGLTNSPLDGRTSGKSEEQYRR